MAVCEELTELARFCCRYALKADSWQSCMIRGKLSMSACASGWISILACCSRLDLTSLGISRRRKLSYSSRSCESGERPHRSTGGSKSGTQSISNGKQKSGLEKKKFFWPCGRLTRRRNHGIWIQESIHIMPPVLIRLVARAFLSRAQLVYLIGRAAGRRRPRPSLAYIGSGYHDVIVKLCFFFENLPASFSVRRYFVGAI